MNKVLPALSYATLIFVIAASAPPHAAVQINVPLDHALVLEGGETTNPREYDPATTHSSGDKLVFSGLVALDPNLRLVPDLAESWNVSPDGMTYTFQLRRNAKFHDGRAVTAQDVIFSWERAASPALGSDTVLTYLGDIIGVREIASGQSENILRGVQAARGAGPIGQELGQKSLAHAPRENGAGKPVAACRVRVREAAHGAAVAAGRRAGVPDREKRLDLRRVWVLHQRSDLVAGLDVLAADLLRRHSTFL